MKNLKLVLLSIVVFLFSLCCITPLAFGQYQPLIGDKLEKSGCESFLLPDYKDISQFTGVFITLSNGKTLVLDSYGKHGNDSKTYFSPATKLEKSENHVVYSEVGPRIKSEVTSDSKVKGELSLPVASFAGLGQVAASQLVQPLVFSLYIFAVERQMPWPCRGRRLRVLHQFEFDIARLQKDQAQARLVFARIAVLQPQAKGVQVKPFHSVKVFYQ